MNYMQHLSPIVALIAGVLILVMPKLLNYIIALYLIVIGLIGLFGR
jgi:energy-converting hydrogenase Eha subunit C